jgi:hypothetical protein
LSDGWRARKQSFVFEGFFWVLRAAIILRAWAHGKSRRESSRRIVTQGYFQDDCQQTVKVETVTPLEKNLPDQDVQLDAVVPRDGSFPCPPRSIARPAGVVSKGVV